MPSGGAAGIARNALEEEFAVNSSRRCVLQMLVSGSIAAIATGRAAALDGAPVTAAVLIGVSQFDHLKIEPLVGPPNDVALMRQALLNIGYAPRDIVELTDVQPASRHPTARNIRRALRQQAQRLAAGDSVIVYFSGHGAQVPQRVGVQPPAYIEPDGLDEVFLTRDTRYWNPRTRTVEGALLDDEIGEALAAFTRKGVQVWAIFDTCHAGDMVRASQRPAQQTVWRGVNGTALGVPAAALLGSSVPRSLIAARQAASPQHLIAFYAAQAHEAAPEEMLVGPVFESGSQDTTEQRRHGVFTWSLARALTSGHTTYQALANAVLTAYAERPFPTPAFEGPLHSAIALPPPQRHVRPDVAHGSRR